MLQMPLPSRKLLQHRSGFTLAELLITIAVLALVAVFVSQLMSGANRITSAGHKRIDSDMQVQQVFDRMAADFDQMIKRSDVSYFFKAANMPMTGNDQIAFFASATGHFPPSSNPNGNSRISLIAYRVNAIVGNADAANYNRLERMGKGLLWNGVSTSITPIVYLPFTIFETWPAATDNISSDGDYGLVGSQVFRFEYYYLLNPSGPSGLSGLSAGPWADSNGSFKIKDVATVVVAIGVIDPRSRSLLRRSQMETIAGTNGQASPFGDFTIGNVGRLLSDWQTVLATDSQIAAMPPAAVQNIRFYERYFPLNQ
jgi:prepilin-type N-terminal cleavage/methylation domain-containing protein